MCIIASHHLRFMNVEELVCNKNEGVCLLPLFILLFYFILNMNDLLDRIFHGTPSSVGKEIIQNHAVHFNFSVTVKRSDKKKEKMTLQCIHGLYRNTHNLTQASRTRNRGTNKTNCPWQMVLKLIHQGATDLTQPQL